MLGCIPCRHGAAERRLYRAPGAPCDTGRPQCVSGPPYAARRRPDVQPRFPYRHRFPAHRAGGIGLAAIGAIAASGKAIIVKLGLRHGVDATTLLALRMLMALPLFVLMALWAARRAEPLSWADRARVLWLGFTGYYLSSLLDFQGLQYISVTLERLILYLNPTLVLLINVLLARQRPAAGRSVRWC